MFFASAVGEKQCFDTIVNKLVSSPYGMRRGPLPLIILDAILKLNGTPIFYRNNKEVVIDTESVVNAVVDSSNYYFYLEEKSAAKDEYIKNLEALFIDYSNYCKDVEKRNKLNRVSCLIQSWCRSLPQTTILFAEPDYLGQDMKRMKKFRKLFTDFYLNPREILFEELPKLFGTNNYVKVYDEVRTIKMDKVE